MLHAAEMEAARKRVLREKLKARVAEDAARREVGMQALRAVLGDDAQPAALFGAVASAAVPRLAVTTVVPPAPVSDAALSPGYGVARSPRKPRVAHAPSVAAAEDSFLAAGSTADAALAAHAAAVAAVAATASAAAARITAAYGDPLPAAAASPAASARTSRRGPTGPLSPPRLSAAAPPSSSSAAAASPLPPPRDHQSPVRSAPPRDNTVATAIAAAAAGAAAGSAGAAAGALASLSSSWRAQRPLSASAGSARSPLPTPGHDGRRPATAGSEWVSATLSPPRRSLDASVASSPAAAPAQPVSPGGSRPRPLTPLRGRGATPLRGAIGTPSRRLASASASPAPSTRAGVAQLAAASSPVPVAVSTPARIHRHDDAASDGGMDASDDGGSGGGNGGDTSHLPARVASGGLLFEVPAHDDGEDAGAGADHDDADTARRRRLAAYHSLRDRKMREATGRSAGRSRGRSADPGAGGVGSGTPALQDLPGADAPLRASLQLAAASALSPGAAALTSPSGGYLSSAHRPASLTDELASAVSHLALGTGDAAAVTGGDDGGGVGVGAGFGGSVPIRARRPRPTSYRQHQGAGSSGSVDEFDGASMAPSIWSGAGTSPLQEARSAASPPRVQAPSAAAAAVTSARIAASVAATTAQATQAALARAVAMPAHSPVDPAVGEGLPADRSVHGRAHSVGAAADATPTAPHPRSLAELAALRRPLASGTPAGASASAGGSAAAAGSSRSVGGRPSVGGGGGSGAASVGSAASSSLSSAATNRKRVVNALQTVCLAGGHRATELDAALAAIEKQVLAASAAGSRVEPCFLILLSSPEAQTYRGLYAIDHATGTTTRIHGTGPHTLTAAVHALAAGGSSSSASGGGGGGAAAGTSSPSAAASVATGSVEEPRFTVTSLQKYSTGQRRFERVHGHSLGLTTDAITIKPVKAA